MKVIILCVVQAPTASVSKPTQAYAYKTYPLIKQSEELLKEGSLKLAATQTIKKNSQLILQHAPLNDDALLHLSLAGYLQSGFYENPNILKAAMERNARNRTTIKSMLQSAAHMGDFKSFLQQIDILYRLNNGTRDTYSSILDRLYNNTEGRKALQSYLSTKPAWGSAFLSRKISDSNNIDDIQPLILAFLNAQEDITKNSLLVRGYLVKLIQNNKFADAYKLWKQYGNGKEPTGSINFNPNFKKTTAIAPFNWKLFYSNTAGAQYERTPRGGAYVFFNNDKPQMLMRQIFPVPSNTPLQFSMKASGTYKERKGEFEWRMICHPLNKIFFSYKLNPENLSVPAENIAPVPDNCSFIELQLFGYPNIYSARISMILEEVSISTKKSSFE